MSLIAKVHDSPNEKVLAICDSDILGKKFEKGNMQLDLDSHFYRGEKMTEEELDVLFKAY